MARHSIVALSVVIAAAAAGARADAQTVTARPWGRISFLAQGSHAEITGAPAQGVNELTASLTYHAPESDQQRFDYGLDMRRSAYNTPGRKDRVSLYEAYVGARFAGGAARVRAGHVWLNDLGALGAVAGGVLEIARPQPLTGAKKLRAGVFAGLEPDMFDAGYADNVLKGGAFVAYEGNRNRRHVAGLVLVRNHSLLERSVLTVTNFIPVKQNLYVYQAAELDVRAPAGEGRPGLTYLFANARYLPLTRVELQGSYNRGRSIDTRTLSDDVLNGRPVTQAAANGFLYESIGGRVTVEALPRVRLYGGYARDRNDRDADPTGRTLVGGYASNVAGTGLDISASDARIDRPDGSYHSRYASAGRQLGRHVYLTIDCSTSLSVVRFSRSDGITVELKPHTTRYSASGNINLGRTISLLATLERTTEDDRQELRVLSAITYRIR